MYIYNKLLFQLCRLLAYANGKYYFLHILVLRFGCSLQDYDITVSQVVTAMELAASVLRVIGSFETLLTTSRTAQFHKPEHHTLNYLLLSSHWKNIHYRLYARVQNYELLAVMCGKVVTLT